MRGGWRSVGGLLEQTLRGGDNGGSEGARRAGHWSVHHSDSCNYLARPVENLAVRQGLRTILFLIEHSGDAPFSLDPRRSHPSGTSDSLERRRIHGVQASNLPILQLDGELIEFPNAIRPLPVIPRRVRPHTGNGPPPICRSGSEISGEKTRHGLFCPRSAKVAQSAEEDARRRRSRSRSPWVSR